MLYPVIVSRVAEDLELFIPEPEKVRAIYEETLAANPGTPFPFWAKIWPSAYAMSSFLEKNPSLVHQKKVLELGAGIGLPSFTIAGIASSVTISDHSHDAVTLAKKNIDHLALKNVFSLSIDWNHFTGDIPADVLLLSDINYASDQFAALLWIITHYLKQGATIILATPQRINITPFAESLLPFTRQSALQVHEEGGQQTEIRILVLSE